MSYPQLAEGSWVQLKSAQLIDKTTAEDQAGYTSVSSYRKNVPKFLLQFYIKAT